MSNEAEKPKAEDEDPKKAKLRSEFDALSAEMEVANYAVNHYGRSRRKISRQQSKVRTIKRKSLEVKDAKVAAIQTTRNRKRIRGSRAALGDDVIKGSSIFGASSKDTRGGDDDDEEEEKEEDSDDALSAEDDEKMENDEEQDNQDSEEEEGRYELYADELNIDIEEDDGDEDSDEGASPKKAGGTSTTAKTSSSAALRVKTPAGKFSGKKIAKTMYKLKNFKSFKMAQKHGEALGAHARGLNISAVTKLKAVASAAPVAPQIYSSLGLVYESMLRDETEKAKRAFNNSNVGENQSDKEGKGFEACKLDDEQPIDRGENIESVKERIKLAKKTFGSYHVAALLCKMDYSLWIRAGDAALTIANLHSLFLTLPPVMYDDTNPVETNNATGESEDTVNVKITTPEEYVNYHQEERIQWLEEAKRDFQSADNLHPPGISIPCKLAHTQMELGHVSEALTILTDLKNKSQRESEQAAKSGKSIRTELEQSFSAWLLYADLMLIIGHECLQWNRGIQTNENYMFRRWLRKYSEHFDWQERRFQALYMALEAAAGTKTCRRLLLWIQERMLRMKSDDGSKQDNGGNWEVCDTYEMDRRLQEQKAASQQSEDNGQESPAKRKDGDNPLSDEVELDAGTNSNHVITSGYRYSNDLEELSKAFNRDREAMLAANKSELSAFDSETREINLEEGSSEFNLRNKEREAIVKKHQQAFITLAVNFQEQNKILEQQQASKYDNLDAKGKELEMSGTCAIVCDIAAQLVKQCLAMSLYHGGRHACEAVSFYLQERAQRYVQRKAKWQSFEERQAFNGKSILQLGREDYDNIPDGGSDDEGSVMILSDDEDFDSPGGEKLIQIMKDGMLTPELQVLYGLSLISEDKLTFLATKMLNAMADFESDTFKDFELLSKDTSDISLRLFRRTMAEPMNKLDAFAFSSDVLKKSDKEEEWADKLLPTFETYLEELKRENALGLLTGNTASETMFKSVKRKNYLKVMFSTFRMKLFKAKKMATSEEGKKIGFDLCMSILDNIFRYQDALWSMKSDGNPLPDSVELLNILSSVFSLAISCLESTDHNYGPNLFSLLGKLKTCVSLICQIDLNDLYTCKSSMLSENWRHFPIPSSWQSDENTIMSRSAYNLCVSCSVSSFSGWERDEFTLNLLKKNRKDTFFGVNITGQRVAGWLSKDAESYLSELWKCIELLVPTLSALDFDNAAANAKKVDWYKKVVENLESNFKDVPIACHGEDSALNILFIFAHATLLLARHEQDDIKSEALLKHAISIILPTTQFHLDQSLWDSELGIKGTDENAEWQIFAAGESTFTPKARSKPSKKSSFNKSSHYKPSHDNKVTNNAYSSKSPFKKLVKVSAEVLLREWNGKETFEESDEDDDIIDSRLNKWSNSVSGPSKLAMKKLDYSIQKLRQCLTINSLQKASLQVSLSMLDVAEQKECRNPFLCLSQAAIFASQGAKGGNNDEEFKKPLPREADCTAEEALHILGRADCLRAIHFINEALFLCSFAARVCCLHRDKKETDHPWTPKWRIIGIMTYTVSLGIDSVIFSLMEGEERRLALDSWEKGIRAEIGRGRSDAIAMQKAFSRLQVASSSRPDLNLIKTGVDETAVEEDGTSENETTGQEGDEDEEMYEEEPEGEGDAEYFVDNTSHNGDIDQYEVDGEKVPPLPEIEPANEGGMDYTNIPTIAL